jgi:hypothetical protein
LKATGLTSHAVNGFSVDPEIVPKKMPTDWCCERQNQKNRQPAP